MPQRSDDQREPRELSAIQDMILHFVTLYYGARGYSPSVREITAGVHLHSTSSTIYQLRQLEAKGYIRRDPVVSRGIVLLEQEVPQ